MPLIRNLKEKKKMKEKTKKIWTNILDYRTGTGFRSPVCLCREE